MLHIFDKAIWPYILLQACELSVVRGMLLTVVSALREPSFLVPCRQSGRVDAEKPGSANEPGQTYVAIMPRGLIPSVGEGIVKTCRLSPFWNTATQLKRRQTPITHFYQIDSNKTQCSSHPGLGRSLSKLKFQTSALLGPSEDSTSPTCCITLGSSAHFVNPLSRA